MSGLKRPPSSAPAASASKLVITSSACRSSARRVRSGISSTTISMTTDPRPDRRGPIRLQTRITATDRRRYRGTASSPASASAYSKYADDIRIPLKYGVDRCVGDTICAGILYGQRNIGHSRFLPRHQRSPRQVPELRQPDGDGGDRIMASRYDRLPRRAAWRRADRRYGGARNSTICSSINHQTWFVDVRLQGPQRSAKDELIATSRRIHYSSQKTHRALNGSAESIPDISAGIRASSSAGSTPDWIHGRRRAICAIRRIARNWFKRPIFRASSRRTGRRSTLPAPASMRRPRLRRRRAGSIAAIQHQEWRDRNPVSRCDHRVTRLRRSLRLMTGIAPRGLRGDLHRFDRVQRVMSGQYGVAGDLDLLKACRARSTLVRRDLFAGRSGRSTGLVVMTLAAAIRPCAGGAKQRLAEGR